MYLAFIINDWATNETTVTIIAAITNKALLSQMSFMFNFKHDGIN